MKTYKAGECYQIKRIAPDIDQHFRQKLLSMGLIPGAIITIKRIAPMRDPLHIEVNGSELSVRKRDLSLIILEKVENGH